jgi:hypothetical protein
MKPQVGEGSSDQGSGGGGKGHEKAPKKKGAKPPLGKDQCRRCGKTRHNARECPVPCKAPKAEAHLVAADDGEATLLMTMFCALHDVEPEAKEVAARTEEVPRQNIFLDEARARVHLETKGGTTE